MKYYAIKAYKEENETVYNSQWFPSKGNTSEEAFSNLKLRGYDNGHHYSMWIMEDSREFETLDEVLGFIKGSNK